MAEYDEIHLRELAERIYQLDEQVYKDLGSSLGRVFHGSHDKVVGDLHLWMQLRVEAHTVRTRLVMIGNMARTIQDKEKRDSALKEYDEILRELQELPNNFASGKIIDTELASLNSMSLTNRFAKGQQLIICISRTYGSGGSSIGFKLADKLHINYYDVEVLRDVMQRLEVEKDDAKNAVGFTEKEQSETPESWLRQKLKAFSRYHGLSEQDAIFFNQSDLIAEMAKRESFVIMGRYAEVVLTNNRIPHISIFVTAPMPKRIKWVMEERGMDSKEAIRFLRKSDRDHAKNYRYYTGRRWGQAVNYDLCINSAAYGIPGSVEMIRTLIRHFSKGKKEEK